MAKKLTVIVSCLLVCVLLFTACGGGAGKKKDGKKDKFLVCMTSASSDEFDSRLKDCVKAACDKYGMDLIYSSGDGNIEQQIADVEDFVAKGADFVLIRSVDADGAIPAAEYCKEHGVPCAGAEFDVNSDACTTHFLFPEIGYGLGAGLGAKELLEDNPDLTLYMGHIWVNSSWAPEWERWDSFCSVIQEYIDNGRVVIVDQQESQNDSTKGMSITEDWLVSHPEINCIFGNNDAMAYIAAGAAAGNGKKMNEEFWVFGIEGTNDGLIGVRDGIMYSTSIVDDLQERQDHWIELVYKYLTGEIELEEKYSWESPASLVSVKNIDDYVGLIK